MDVPSGHLSIRLSETKPTDRTICAVCFNASTAGERVALVGVDGDLADGPLDQGSSKYNLIRRNETSRADPMKLFQSLGYFGQHLPDKPARRLPPHGTRRTTTVTIIWTKLGPNGKLIADGVTKLAVRV